MRSFNLLSNIIPHSSHCISPSITAPGDCSCGEDGGGGDAGGRLVREAGPGLRPDLSPGDFSCGASGSPAEAATADTDMNEGGEAGGRLVREAGPGLRTGLSPGH